MQEKIHGLPCWLSPQGVAGSPDGLWVLPDNLTGQGWGQSHLIRDPRKQFGVVCKQLLKWSKPATSLWKRHLSPPTSVPAGRKTAMSPRDGGKCQVTTCGESRALHPGDKQSFILQALAWCHHCLWPRGRGTQEWRMRVQSQGWQSENLFWSWLSRESPWCCYTLFCPGEVSRCMDTPICRWRKEAWRGRVTFSRLPSWDARAHAHVPGHTTSPNNQPVGTASEVRARRCRGEREPTA